LVDGEVVPASGDGEEDVDDVRKTMAVSKT
jgi:hypothetical protein